MPSQTLQGATPQVRELVHFRVAEHTGRVGPNVAVSRGPSSRSTTIALTSMVAATTMSEPLAVLRSPTRTSGDQPTPAPTLPDLNG